MPQYLVIARDGTDDQAPARRQAARSAHLAALQPFAEKGAIIVGGAILDEAGGMVGSVCVVDFATRAELDAWLANDPYVTGKVWQHIEVEPIRIAVQPSRA